VILVDTSAWIEFLRRSGSRADLAVTRLIQEDADLATTDPVVLELLCGAGSDERAATLRRFLLAFDHEATRSPGDYEDAATIYRMCRDRGETIRSLWDCLIAAVALRSGASVLHRDRDYEAIARHTTLVLERI